ncbi:helix-turn-helix domain-containing protein [Chitinophaga silvisoli]|uniref:AraC family transcriptional regulator n=1 Tax=Chitinophaga silvisoli TaxID=2291814 RepID=A0A3E1P087_9BACT|nr:AraC family transcriptional regulator [Chitinophaga silvisoli]RFM33555.1 AraC family transcriptional regulator [Chitinophaga silvisoli]
MAEIIFRTFLSTLRKEDVAFLEHNILLLQVAGQYTLETADQKVSLKKGQLLLIGKNQLGQVTKQPLPGEDYETILISLQEDMLRNIALEEQVEVTQPYTGPRNIRIPSNDFLQGFFQSIQPYVRKPADKIHRDIGNLKVKEAVILLLDAVPALRNFLFDFSTPYKIDLKKFMLRNFHYNVPIAKFAELTGRSLAGFKRDFKTAFGLAPRQWLLEKRLTEARHLIEKKKQKPAAIYLDLGFESLSHFSYSFKKKFGKAPSEWE